jgi:hypothetical protein
MFQIHVGRKTDAPRALPDIAFRWLDGRGRGHSRRRGNWSALLRDRDARRIRADAKRIRADAKRLVKQRQDAGALRLFSLPPIPNESTRRTSTMRRLATVLILVAGAAALVRFAVVPWAQNWGRRVDDSGPLPGDDLVDEATAIETRSIDINATPEEIWPWLAQMGYGRAGWYSYDALDMNMPSTKGIRPELVDLKVGDVMPTHPAGGFLVRVLDAPKALVLYLDTELVRRQAEEAEADEAAAGPVNIRATGALMENAQPADFEASWAFVLEPTASGTTRLIERFRVRFGADDRPWLGFTMPVMGFGVFVMMRKQMLGIRERAERSTRAHQVPVELAAAS